MQGSADRDTNNDDSGTKLLVLGSPEGSSYTTDQVYVNVVSCSTDQVYVHYLC